MNFPSAYNRMRVSSAERTAVRVIGRLESRQVRADRFAVVLGNCLLNLALVVAPVSLHRENRGGRQRSRRRSGRRRGRVVPVAAGHLERELLFRHALLAHAGEAGRGAGLRAVLEAGAEALLVVLPAAEVGLHGRALLQRGRGRGQRRPRGRRWVRRRGRAGGHRRRRRVPEAAGQPGLGAVAGLGQLGVRETRALPVDRAACEPSLLCLESSRTSRCRRGTARARPSTAPKKAAGRGEGGGFRGGGGGGGGCDGGCDGGSSGVGGGDGRPGRSGRARSRCR